MGQAPVHGEFSQPCRDAGGVHRPSIVLREQIPGILPAITIGKLEQALGCLVPSQQGHRLPWDIHVARLEVLGHVEKVLDWLLQHRRHSRRFVSIDRLPTTSMGDRGMGYSRRLCQGFTGQPSNLEPVRQISLTRGLDTLQPFLWGLQGFIEPVQMLGAYVRQLQPAEGRVYPPEDVAVTADRIVLGSVALLQVDHIQGIVMEGLPVVCLVCPYSWFVRSGYEPRQRPAGAPYSAIRGRRYHYPPAPSKPHKKPQRPQERPCRCSWPGRWRHKHSGISLRGG